MSTVLKFAARICKQYISTRLSWGVVCLPNFTKYEYEWGALGPRIVGNFEPQNATLIDFYYPGVQKTNE
jgi:hypothetical protein